MSKLAASLAEAEIAKPDPTPRASCFPLYGACDAEDVDAVMRLREDQIPWQEVQRVVDDLLGIDADRAINNRRFIRHWKSECSCPTPTPETKSLAND